MKTAVILGITSDIGRDLAVRLVGDGWAVWGTYREGGDLAGVPRSCRLVVCDVGSPASIDAFGEVCRREGIRWDAVIVSVGTEEPIGSFWDCDADEWDQSVTVNALGPLRVLRRLYPLRNRMGAPGVALFSGSGTNSGAPAYSAYCASKILLIKMCELLDSESEDTSVFIIGPGIVRTKIHQQTLRAAERSGANFRRTVEFLDSPSPGTSHDEIYDCLCWCLEAGKPVIGGRNVSLVYDSWRAGGRNLAACLKRDPELYKLRRFGNDLKVTGESRR